jgi:hypothetical protein
MKLYGSNARTSRSQVRAARLHRPLEALHLGPPRVGARRQGSSRWSAWLVTLAGRLGTDTTAKRWPRQWGRPAV